MTIEKLLCPRFKLMNNYPDCAKDKLAVGSIISFQFYTDETKQWYNDDGKSKIYDAYYEGYPHLFKKLNWWEGREEEDMPMYLKHTSDKDKKEYSYHKVIRWNMRDYNGVLADGLITEVCSLLTWDPEWTYIPVTEKEYLKNVKLES